MIVFKTFLKVLNKCKAPIIMYTIFLVFFGGFNLTTSDNSTTFTASKPDIFIINNDVEEGITKHLINYFESNSNIVDIRNEEDGVNDALFYRDVSYVIYIPSNYRNDFLAKKNPEIKIKKTNDYEASLANMMLERYIKIANVYNEISTSEEELINNIDETLNKNVKVSITSKLDKKGLEKATFYYNFTNYTLLAGSIYVICLILSSFREEKIRKRTIVSSMDYKKYNRNLLLSNSLFAFTLWLLYVVLSFILLGNVMFSMHGLVYIINSLIFTLCSLSLAFLIGNIVNNKDAINGIVNVIALGSSFLCGAFVPMEYLPNFVLNIAHILPSYWYIKSNELLKSIEIINLETIKPIIINMGIIVIFSIIFIVITNIVSKRRK